MDLSWFHDPVLLVVNMLVAYRVTRLWIDDSLPPLPMLRSWITDRLTNVWDRNTIRLRARLGLGNYEYARRERAHPDHPLLRLLDCYWCAGMWISLGTFLAASLVPATVWPFIALPLALSAAVGLLGSRD